MEILLAITLILVPGGTVSATPPDEITYPIEFAEVTSEAHVYTDIDLYTFQEPFNLTQDFFFQFIHRLFTTTYKENHEYINQDDVTVILELQERVINLTKQELSSVLFELTLNTDSHIRHKRGILDYFYSDDGKKPPEADDAIRELSHTIKEIVTYIENNRQIVNYTQQLLAKIRFVMTLRDLLHTELTYLFFHYDKTQDACKRQVIPSNSITLRKLNETLQEKESELQLRNLTLAIPLENIQDYYKLRMCTCQFSDNAINMVVNIPVKPRDAAYKLFSPMYLPFKFHNRICSIRARDAILIKNINNSSDIHVLSSAQYLKECNLDAHLCKLQHSIPSPSIDSLCLQGAFLKKPVGELLELCPYDCIRV